MQKISEYSRTTLISDLTSGLVVFLVALPLCLGIAQASGTPLISGLVAGIIGGIVVGAASGSHVSVSGPAAGLTAVVAAQLTALGSLEAFLLALVIAGVIQVVFGLVRAGGMSAFVPSSVVNGLLAAIGIILILKQVPHVLGHDTDPEGEMSFIQPDRENTFSELWQVLGDVHPGAAVIGVFSVVLLCFWTSFRPLQKTRIPAAFAVVVFGMCGEYFFRQLGSKWVVGASHLVRVPESANLEQFLGYLTGPDWSQISSPAVYTAAVTIALVASLETLLNLEAVDQLDPEKRLSPPNRELLAQGLGNILSGCLGGLPLTSVIVRSSVNVQTGGKTKMAAVIHGVLLLVAVVFFAGTLNRIPISCLAAILLVTGTKLASPTLFRRMWSGGRYQFAPFIVTVSAIVLTDLLTGVLIGLGVSIAFILNSNLRRPVRQVIEKHVSGEVRRLQLAEQVSFLNRAGLEETLRSAPKGSHILLDAQNTVYIDPDVLHLIRDFRDHTAPTMGVTVSLTGFRQKYALQDEIQFVDYSTRDVQEKLTPVQVLQILLDGNERFRTGRRLTRDLNRQQSETASGQHPMAVVLSCIDSRAPAELVFDQGLGDIFSVRIAGNVISDRVLGSMEYGCEIAGAKLIVVMGHSRCGAVTAAVDLFNTSASFEEATGCQHMDSILKDIQRHMQIKDPARLRTMPTEEKETIVNDAARENVANVVSEILSSSSTLTKLVQSGRIAIVGTFYDVSTGKNELLQNAVAGIAPEDLATVVITDPARIP